jgi:hypothetical protein
MITRTYRQTGKQKYTGLIKIDTDCYGYWKNIFFLNLSKHKVVTINNKKNNVNKIKIFFLEIIAM